MGDSSRREGIFKAIQVVSEKGLHENSSASALLRRELASLGSEDIGHLVDDERLPKRDAGLFLQDVVNEVGRRLGFEVENGLYRGVPGRSGHDGLWVDAAEARKVFVEVKASDVFSLSVAELTRFFDVNPHRAA